MIAQVRLALALAGLSIWLLALAPLQLAFLRVWPAGAAWLPVYFHRGLLLLFGVKWRVQGNTAKKRPLLIVANHLSWLDIAVLGAVTPLSFIAKDEMISWPLFGWLAKMQRSIFVNRKNRQQAARQAAEIAHRLGAGDIMVLFAEGTTSDANRVYQFNSSLIGSAEAVLKQKESDHVLIQPVALVYHRLQGLSMGRYERPIVGWPGEVPLGSHALALLKEAALDVDILFGDPIRFDENSDRKLVATQARSAVRQMRIAITGAAGESRHE